MSNWVSCKDKLPEKDGKYLTTEKCPIMNYPGTLCIRNFTNTLSKVDSSVFGRRRKAGWYDYDSEYGYYGVSDVIAWQELPKPYKETEDAE